VRLPTYADIVEWPDWTLIAWREAAQAELQRNPDPALQRLYDASTQETANRTRRAVSAVSRGSRNAGCTPSDSARA
jgi:hypothetical protein